MKDNQIDEGLLFKSEEEIKLKGRKDTYSETEKKNKFRTKNIIKFELKKEKQINKMISIKSKNKILSSFLFYSFFSYLDFSLGFYFGKEKRLLKKSDIEEIKNDIFEDKKKLGKDSKSKKKKLYIKIHNKNIKDNIIKNEYAIINNIKIILIIIMIFLIQIILSNNEFGFIKYKFSNITLKIKETGNKYVLSTSSNFEAKYNPDMIYINGQNQLPVKRRYNFNQTDNFIELIWNKPIKTVILCFLNVKILLKLIYLILIHQKLQI